MTPLFKKLNFNNHPIVVVINAPESFQPEVEAMNPYTSLETKPEWLDSIPFAMAFVTEQESINNMIQEIGPKLAGDAIVWFCYPKKTSKKYTCTFNRDTGWEALASYDLEPVRQVAIDADWSALRFRKVQ